MSMYYYYNACKILAYKAGIDNSLLALMDPWPINLLSSDLAWSEHIYKIRLFQEHPDSQELQSYCVCPH